MTLWIPISERRRRATEQAGQQREMDSAVWAFHTARREEDSTWTCYGGCGDRPWVDDNDIPDYPHVIRGAPIKVAALLLAHHYFGNRPLAVTSGRLERKVTSLVEFMRDNSSVTTEQLT